MTREEEVKKASREIGEPIYNSNRPIHDVFVAAVKWADQHPSDETIMRILNCIGYKEESWIGFVRKELEKRKI